MELIGSAEATKRQANVGIQQAKQELRDQRWKNADRFGHHTWPVGTRIGSRNPAFFCQRLKRLALSSGRAVRRVPFAGRVCREDCSTMRTQPGTQTGRRTRSHTTSTFERVVR